MPRYLIQLSYTPEAWAAQVKHPQNRIEAVAPALEKVGGRFECAYYAFGPHDLVAIIEAPDNAAAAAFALAVTAGGAVRSYVTTPLLTLEEGLTAMREAAEGRGSLPATSSLTALRPAISNPTLPERHVQQPRRSSLPAVALFQSPPCPKAECNAPTASALLVGA